MQYYCINHVKPGRFTPFNASLRFHRKDKAVTERCVWYAVFVSPEWCNSAAWFARQLALGNNTNLGEP
jgi:hypothetical protein